MRGGRRAQPRGFRVVAKKGEMVADEQRRGVAEFDFQKLNDIRFFHRRIRHDRFPRRGRNTAGGGCGLRAVAGNVKVGLKRARNPTAHRLVKTADQNRHARCHADRADESGDREAMASARRSQMAARQPQRDGINFQFVEKFSKSGERLARKNSRAEKS